MTQRDYTGARDRADGIALESAGEIRYYPRAVTPLLKAGAVFAVVALVAIARGSTVVGQAQPAARGQGQPAAQGRGAAAPAGPAAQAGHGMGKLSLWGDVVNFNPPDTPNQCVAQSRFKRGERIGFRMTAIDGGTGETENTANLVAHVTYGGKTVDVPMRWRGVGEYPKEAYSRPPNDMWTGGWPVPKDAPTGSITYTVTATDRFGRKATYRPFASIPSQLTIVD